VGSILGTFLAGYVLIDLLGAILTAHAVAITLAALAVLNGRKTVYAYAWAAACAAILFVAAAPWPQFVSLGRQLAIRDVVRANVVYVDDSQYSYITVSQDPVQNNIREMSMDRLIHSRVNLDDPTELRYEYEWVYAAVIEKYYPDNAPLKALVIGGGGYALSRSDPAQEPYRRRRDRSGGDRSRTRGLRPAARYDDPHPQHGRAQLRG
jgi:hypothetical protein